MTTAVTQSVVRAGHKLDSNGLSSYRRSGYNRVPTNNNLTITLFLEGMAAAVAELVIRAGHALTARGDADRARHVHNPQTSRR